MLHSSAKLRDGHHRNSIHGLSAINTESIETIEHNFDRIQAYEEDSIGNCQHRFSRSETIIGWNWRVCDQREIEITISRLWHDHIKQSEPKAMVWEDARHFELGGYITGKTENFDWGIPRLRCKFVQWRWKYCEASWGVFKIRAKCNPHQFLVQHAIDSYFDN